MRKRILIACAITAFIQFTAIAGSLLANYLAQEVASDEIKHRISLDVATLDLGKENQVSVANKEGILRYIEYLNDYLSDHAFPMRVKSIDGIIESTLPDEFVRIHTMRLSTNDEFVSVELVGLSWFSEIPFSILAILCGLIYIVLSSEKHENELSEPEINVKQNRNTKDLEVKYPKLVIDLKQKALYLNSHLNTPPVQLSNKPFCFYIALIKVCTSDNHEPLVHHEPIPPLLLEYADATFKKLMNLGHTKRRQPDFSNNLDKTLSEIRAALDEVFETCPLEKNHFYPPKAQGEGSRTKRHSYAIESLDENSLIFIED